MNISATAKAAHSINTRKGATKAREVPFAAQNLSKLPDDSLLDVKSVATILGIGVSTCWSWVAKGLLPQPTRRGRTTRWRTGTIREIAAGSQ